MSVFSRSHRGQMSDSMLTAAFIILSGGLQDAYTYLCRGKVYANAQTGNIVLLSTYLCNGEWAAAGRYLVPVLAFMAGIFAAECVHRRFRRMERVHWRQMILLAEIVLLAAVGFLGTGRRAVSLPPIRGNGPAADGTGLKLRPGPLGQKGGLQRRIEGQHRLPEIAAQRPRPAFPQHIALTVQGQAAALPVIVGTPFCHQGADRPFFLACQFTGQAVTSR